MAHKTALVFDFDGTLSDVWPKAIEIYSQIGSKFGKGSRTADELLSLRHLTGKEILSELGIPLYKLPHFAHTMKKHLYANIPDVNTVPEIDTVTRQLAKEGYSLYIISSSYTRDIEAFLAHHNLTSVFTEIQGSFSLMGKHPPLKRLKKTCEKSGVQIVYIGDELRDAQCAKKAGVDFIAATWGGNNRQAFERFHISPIVDSPNDLLALIHAKYPISEAQ